MLNITLALSLAFYSTAQSRPQRGVDSRTWYQAYADGKRAIQQKNWQAVVDSMEAAKRAGAPKPGRKIPFYGDVYDDFIPDYYLGVAYLNLKQYPEAEKAFESVRASGLIGPRDPEFAQFQTQLSTAKSSALLAQRQPAVPVTKAAGANASMNAPNVPPSTAGQSPQAQSTPSGLATAAQQSPIQATPPPVQSTPSPAGAGVPAPPVGRATSQTNRNAPASVGSVRTSALSIPPKAVTRRSVSPVDEQTAISAYLSGRYDQAAAILAGVESGTGSSPRAYFYLACSRTALAATGQADPASIAGARVILTLAGDQAQFAADKRYISPRVLQMLGVKPQ